MTETQALVARMYKDDAGRPIYLTGGQDDIFSAIAQKRAPRLHIMCHTRYGKSMSAGLAVLTRAASFPEKWAIIAGNKDKAGIIMSVVNAHIFDNDFTKSRFIPEKGDDWEEIRRFRNKNHITFKIADGQYSEIFIGSAKDALGFGAPNILEDESALINDTDHSLVMRMLGDNPVDNFLCKIGNPFARNHFLASFHDPAYLKIVWDCYQSLKEGVRMTQQVIDENRRYVFFKILYECLFPSASEMDESGWMYLVTDVDIEAAQLRQVQPYGMRRLGHDVARGGRNYNAWVLRTDSHAEVVGKDLEADLIKTGDKTMELAKKYNVMASEIFIDDGGVGGGEVDYLASKGCKVTKVNFGSSAEKEAVEVDNVLHPGSTKKQAQTEYANARAEMYAGRDGMAVWLRSIGKLEPHADWSQLTQIRYRKNSSGMTVIEPKEDMRKRGVESPDVADALALTFAKVKNVVYHDIDPATILAGGVKPFFPGMPG